MFVPHTEAIIVRITIRLIVWRRYAWLQTRRQCIKYV